MLTNFRKICFLCLLASLIIFIMASTVNAHQTFLGPSPYLSFSNSPFLGLPFDYFHLEDFEDLALNTPGVDKSTGNIAGPGIWTDSVDVDDGVIDGSGLGGASLYSDTDSGVTFTFNAAALGNLPNHVGIVWTDAEFPRQTSAFLEVFGPSGASIGVFGPHNVGDSTTRGTTAEDRFFGVAYWLDL